MTIDAHTLLAPYAMDALDDAEREAFETHLEVCEECREELAGFVETAARLGAAARRTAIKRHGRALMNQRYEDLFVGLAVR